MCCCSSKSEIQLEEREFLEDQRLKKAIKRSKQNTDRKKFAVALKQKQSKILNFL